MSKRWILLVVTIGCCLSSCSWLEKKLARDPNPKVIRPIETPPPHNSLRGNYRMGDDWASPG